jgi:proteasome component ECM29
VQSGHTKAKIREESALCLGLVAIGDKTLTSEVLNGFLKLIKMSKDPALHIAIAQALVYVIQGTTDVERDLAANVEFNPASEETLCGLLDEIIKIVPDPHTYSRQACGIWLMALVKNCCNRKSVLDKKQILQLAFTDLLSEDSGKLINQ